MLRRDPRRSARDRGRESVGTRRAARPSPSRAPRRRQGSSSTQRIPRGVRAALAARSDVLRRPGDSPPPNPPPAPAERHHRYAAPPAKGLLVLPEGDRPDSERYASVVERVLTTANGHVAVKSIWGPVPLELDHVWPLSQSIVPEGTELEALEAAEVFFREWAAGAGYPFG